MLEYEHEYNHIMILYVSLPSWASYAHIYLLTHCPCRIQDAPRRRWRGTPPRGHACAGGGRDGDAEPAQDSPNEAPRGSLCGCCCVGYDGKEENGESRADSRIRAAPRDTMPRFSAQTKKQAHQAKPSQSIHHSNPHTGTQIIFPQPNIRARRHAPDARAAPSNGLSSREGLAGIRGSTAVQRLSSAALAAAGTTATAALDVVIDAGGNPLGVVVALHGKARVKKTFVCRRHIMNMQTRSSVRE